MTATPKLPFLIRAALCFFGTVAFVSWALAAVSMFVWVGVPLVGFNSEGTWVSLMLKGGVISVMGLKSNIISEALPDYWIKAQWFPSLTDKSLYVFESEQPERGWYFGVPLVSMGLASLLVFLFFVRKTSEMRRKEIFAVSSKDAEEP